MPPSAERQPSRTTGVLPALGVSRPRLDWLIPRDLLGRGLWLACVAVVLSCAPVTQVPVLGPLPNGSPPTVQGAAPTAAVVGADTCSLKNAVLSSAAVISDAGLRRRLRDFAMPLRCEDPPESPEDTLARLPAWRTDRVLLTGYHEPILAGRRRRQGRFVLPILAMPQDPGPHPTRAAIDGGVLANKGLEIFWVDDAIELFFLHIQGSGRLQLEDGRVIGVGYAGTNGRPYTAIGKVLVDLGEMPLGQATAPAIKAWLRANPTRVTSILHSNQRFVFFREIAVSEKSGPPGALGVALVPGRSVAVDSAVVPLGSVGLLEAPLPGGGTLRRAVVAMDRGAAIRGAGRIDLFLGAEPAAAELAGVLRARGRVRWVLGPATVSPPS